MLQTINTQEAKNRLASIIRGSKKRRLFYSSILLLSAASIGCCLAADVSAIFGGSAAKNNPPTSATQARWLRVEGIIKVGSSESTNFDSAVLFGSEVSNNAPLSGIPLPKLAMLSPVVPLPDAPPLTSDSPLVGNNVAGLVSNNAGGLVSNNANGLIAGNAAQFVLTANSERRGILAGNERVAFVELIAPDTGSLLARVRATASGRYVLAIAEAPVARSLVVQATALTDNKVSGYLAAPLYLSAKASGVRNRDISPGTTVVTFAQTLLAGVRGEFRVATGFRGFKTNYLASLITEAAVRAEAKASSTFDTHPSLVAAKKFDDIASFIASSSATMAKVVEDTASESAGTAVSAAHVIAADNQLISRLGEKPATADAPITEIIAEAAEQVKPQEVRNEASEISSKAATEQASLSLPLVVPSPTPAPAPSGNTPAGNTPAGSTPSPSVAPTPTPTPTPTPVPQVSGSFD
ncbi:MAG: hypothetical protein HY692_06055 [Cyanobacteria bacterium NC_groundwater_1444_Ag_S-0.65um_54_12]|nr:hypothetical protein [Cyanobacteria bacterium NC_groundwater_1444_Ag_S-0.65um_54_12]